MDVIVEEEGAGEQLNRDHETEVVSPPPIRLSWPPSSPALASLT